MLRQRSVIRSMTWDVWIILSSQIHSKVKNINYWYLLIFKKFITLFRRCCQSRSRAYFKGFLIQNQKKILWNKKFSAAASISFDEGIVIVRSSQSETFKKGHKINTGIFYRKNANFFPINVLYKIFQILNQKNHENCHLLKKVKISKVWG